MSTTCAPQRYILKLFTADEKILIFIPFVCKRCGKCCRKIGVSSRAIDIAAVVEYLGTGVREVIENYIGKVVSCDEEKIEYEASSAPRLPCPFLRGNECIIHPIKPGVCAAFPVRTDFGDHGIGCPGKEEVTRASRALEKGVPCAICAPAIYDETPVGNIPPDKWGKILAKYRKSNPSKEALKLFLKFNRPKSCTPG